METRAHYVLVGAFTIVMAALLMLFSLWVAKAKFDEDYKVFEIVFDGPVRGLTKGGEVRFNGIQVGEITNLRLDEVNPQLVVARVRIDGKTPVRTSSEARLEAMGLTGVNLIQITAGDLADPLLKSDPAKPARIRASPGALDDLVQTGQDLANRAERALTAIEKILSEKNVKHLNATIEHLDAASAELAKPDGAITQVAEAAKSVRALSDDTRGKLDTVFVKIDSAASDVADAAKHSKQFMASAQDAADIAANEALPDISSAARDLRRLSISLQQLANDADSGSLNLIPGSGQAKPTVKVDQ
ncbi:MAG TPA: MlaD family protein [Caulobacterales bacterium]|jgi:phospholipid/cholesterol/gamma-HCH transport system substrate-binding protein|nr:MlaD family protein [Caulobacterales bacterium]